MSTSKKRSMKQSSLLTAFRPKKATRKDGEYTLFCDLDGVLVDFEQGVQDLFGKTPDQVPSRVLWPAIHKNSEFYSSLQWMSDGKKLWDALRTTKPYILTGCSAASASSQKFEWCKRELGCETNHVDMAAPKKRHERVSGKKKQGMVNVITCWSKNKHCESAPGHVLIDDRVSLREDWERAGGIFVHHTSTEGTLKELRSKGILTTAATCSINDASQQEEETVATEAPPKEGETVTSQASKEEEKGVPAN
jgi:hypothetical protein